VRTAAVWAALSQELSGDPSAFVLDAGGGTGGFAVPLAALGHTVTVVDASPDSLAALARRAAEAGVSDRVLGVQGDVHGLLEVAAAGAYDAVLLHNVLEIVDDPGAAVAAVSAVLRPGGLASVLAPNRVAVSFHRALAGHFEEAAHALDDPAGRYGDGDAVLRRFRLDELVGLLEGHGLAVQDVHGVRVFADLVPGGLLDAEPGAADALAALELAAANRPAFREVASQLHLLARRR
jgi:2-polyprenyl-3-methyl-5-hydroxy-6-metoxy-1,4-benzoquinol methylase